MYEYLICIIEHHDGRTTHTYRLETFGLPQFVWSIMVRHNIDATMSAASVARKILYLCVGGTPPSI